MYLCINNLNKEYMRKVTGIYAIHNLITGKKYVGKSVDIFSRWRRHIKDLRDNTHHSTHLQNTWNKYGEANFVFGIIEEYSVGELSEAEERWVSHFSCVSNGYNCLNPSTDMEQRVFSKKQIDHISNKIKQWHADPANKAIKEKAMQKASITRKNNFKIGLIEKRAEIPNKVLLYNKDTHKLEFEFDTVLECANFFKVSKQQLQKRVCQCYELDSRYWNYKGYYVIKASMTLDKLLNRELIYKLNMAITAAKEGRHSPYLPYIPKVRKRTCTDEELLEISLHNIEKATRINKERRSLLPDSIVVLTKDTKETVGYYKTVNEAATTLGLKPNKCYDAYRGPGVRSYKGFIFKSIEV